MSLFTRNKVFFSADRTTYWEYDPGDGSAALTVNGTEVVSATSTGVTLSAPLTQTGALTASSNITAETLDISGLAAFAGRVSVGAGMSWSLDAGVASLSTLSLDTVVSAIPATDAIRTMVLPLPTSAGIVKIVANLDQDSTHHIDMGTGLITGFATASNINMLPNACVGLISVSSLAWKIMFPTTVATIVVTTLTT